MSAVIVERPYGGKIKLLREDDGLFASSDGHVLRYYAERGWQLVGHGGVLEQWEGKASSPNFHRPGNKNNEYLYGHIDCFLRITTLN